MRMLIFHADFFKTLMTEKSRSKIVEEVQEKSVAVQESLVIFSSVEKGDEQNPDAVVENAKDEISKIAEQLKVKTVVLHSFAHLFAELARPDVAIEVLKSLQRSLQSLDYLVERTPFGWFNTIELKAKGHPLSRIARIISG